MVIIFNSFKKKENVVVVVDELTLWISNLQRRYIYNKHRFSRVIIIVF